MTTHCDLGDHDAPTAGAISVKARALDGIRAVVVCADCQARFMDMDRFRAEAPYAITELEVAG